MGCNCTEAFAWTGHERRKMARAHSLLFAFVTLLQHGSACLLWLSLVMLSDAQNPTSEVKTLLSFKYSITSQTTYAPGGYWSTWKETDENPCTWAGVTCTANSTVEELNLAGWGLTPQLSLAVLCNLTDLRRLDLSSNGETFLQMTSQLESSSNLTTLGWTIPEDIGTLTGLTYVDLSSNGYGGTIPPSISTCSNLRYISLGQNKLEGEIPSLSGLLHLQVLHVANNQLTGLFPKDLGGMRTLVSVDLSNNQFSGPIPSLSNLKVLVDLRLDNNFFVEFEEPFFLDGNSILEHLSISGNQLKGPISPSIANMLNLEVLNMSGNQLSGQIPLGLTAAHLRPNKFWWVDLSQNQLSGSIPTNFLNPPIGVTVSINLSHNLLTGNIPVHQHLTCLILDLSYNQLSGRIPFLFNNTVIASLSLQNNLLFGDIVDVLLQSFEVHTVFRLQLPNIYFSLWLQNNFFTGDLSRIMSYLTNYNWQNLEVLDLSNNNLQWSTKQILQPAKATEESFPTALREFRVGGNNFSGASLPTTLYSPGSHLEALDLSNCHLAGVISAAALNSMSLPSLKILNLSNNYLTGPILDKIILLPDLIVLDVAQNNLSGPLPRIQPSSSLYNPSFFANNSELCGAPLDPCTTQSISTERTGVQSWVLLIIVGGSTIGTVGSCLVATWRWRLYSKRHLVDASLIKTLLEGESATLMSLRELKRATNNFAQSAQIGEGGFGTVYKGKLNDGTVVAIKRSKRDGFGKDREQFLNEVRILTQVNHRNLVKLLGCCMENKTLLLVFEFVSNGTLQEHLQGKIQGARLCWRQRLNVAIQIADALNYLHSTTTFPIYHRDVKSANILLNDSLNVKVTDFGVSKLVPVESSHVSTIAVHGTMGYIDPEYYTTFKLTDRSDVYSFGVVLLELISAKPVIDYHRSGDETSLVIFASPHIESGDLQQLIDPSLMETYNDVTSHERESILHVGRLALKCLDMRSKARPSMNKVWQKLQNILLEHEGTTIDLSSITELNDGSEHDLSQSFSSNESDLVMQLT